MFVASTTAFATTAPVGSTVVPVIVPRSLCASTVITNENKQSTRTNRMDQPPDAPTNITRRLHRDGAWVKGNLPSEHHHELAGYRIAFTTAVWLDCAQVFG